jgi:hypothetical protein
MSKKNVLLVVFAVALAAVYAIWFTDWFKPKTIHIFHTSRNLRPRLQLGNAMPPLTFGLDHAYKLTEIKVVPLAEFQTNAHVLPLWHLISDSNSVPVKLFPYGLRIGHMRPAVAGKRADPLQTNVAYRIFISAGKTKGQHDFELGGKLPDATNSASN